MNVFQNIAAGEVEKRVVLAGDQPFRMFPVDAACGIDTLELNPDSELHAVRADGFDDFAEAAGKFFRMNGPVAHALLPAGVNDEEFAADVRRARDQIKDVLFGHFRSADAGVCVENNRHDAERRSVRPGGG